ncbi:hypothetical protein BP6252_00148 [Coleophoma cylindrospora]|uniref:Uncharacterized protein n=1 Tax=Coleophoma cylindrospora TaxID=1849047 RepID=A0A3D8SP98_9HELO|nr:hypothetical protein BP6252_00148 [Coleophoma cylindrospora]
MESRNATVALSNAIEYLVETYPELVSGHLASHYSSGDLETYQQLDILRSILCVRPPTAKLPAKILDDIVLVLRQEQEHKVLTPSSSIPELSGETQGSVKIKLWKGDITSLAEVTAIVNAANSQMLGCFRPEHKCIDNVIHAAAGPGLRDECGRLMEEQKMEEPVGTAKVTKGYCLPAEHVIHTVGPQLGRGRAPSEKQTEQLRSCYISCLEAAEKLPPLEDGRKVLVFCCISTGLFAFPQALASKIAVSTVLDWVQSHPATTITDVIFDVFSDADYEEYVKVLATANLLPPTSTTLPLPLPNATLQLASTWLKEADTLIISAGAGLSASTGLDYTSTTLFSRHFPAFLQYGFRRLYDLFGPYNWPSPQIKWGYYFTHLQMVRSWPKSPVYASLLNLANTFGEGNVHVRTSNVDGMFVRNGFPAEVVSTPQGQYRILQCVKNCREDATFLSEDFLDAALPFIDPKTQVLTDASKVPLCKYCGGDMFICVRAADWFNQRPFTEGECRWKQFRRQSLAKGEERRNNVVILELGVGMSTPGVLRWPNEDLAGRAGGNVKLIRVGLDASGCVDWDFELGVGIQGDIAQVIRGLASSRDHA